MVFGLPISISLFGIGSALMVIGWLLSGRLIDFVAWLRHSEASMAIVAVALIAALGLLGASAITPYVLTLLGGYLSLLLAVLVAYYLKEGSLLVLAQRVLAGAALFTLACTYLGIWQPVQWAFSQATGWGADHSVMGVYLSQSMFFIFIGWWMAFAATEVSSKLKKISLSAYAFLAFFSVIFLTRGRAGFVALVLTFVVAVFFAGQKKLKAFLLVCISAALVAGFMSPLMGPALLAGADELANLVDLRDVQGSWDSRFAMNVFALKSILDAPLWGYGLGGYRELAAAWFNSSVVQNFPHAHNQFLMSWLEFGIFGLFAWMWIFIGVWRDGRHCIGFQRTLIAVLLTLFFVDGMTDSSTWLANKRNVFIVLLGLVTAASLNSKRAQQSALNG